MLAKRFDDLIDSAKRKILRLYHRRQSLSMHADVSYQLLSEPGIEYFFGYYDITPFSYDCTRILAGRRALSNGKTAAGTNLEFGFFQKDASGFGDFKKLGETSTWCWQQGARLQWLGDQVLYNCDVDGAYGAKIINPQTGDVVKTMHSPVYSLSPHKEEYLSLNFSRLQNRRPGYGYSLYTDQFKTDPCPHGDGIWLHSVSSDQGRMICSLAQAAEISPRASMERAYHYFNHLYWNPSGTRFLVFHLWDREDGRDVRLMTMDQNGQQAWALNDVRASHYWWINETDFILYGTHQTFGEGYFLYRDQNDEATPLGKDCFSLDGHPSVDPSGQWMLTDTVSNRLAERDIYLYHLKEGRKISVASLHSPTNFRHERKCDLHPRFSPNGQYVCVDTTLSGKRAMALFDVSKVVGEI